MANKRKAEEALGVASGSTAASRGSTGPGAREKGATRPEITITATDIFGPSPVRPPASKKKKTKPKRKTLTTKGRRAVVYNVLATVEANKVARPSVASNGTSTVAGAPAQPPPPDHSQEDVRNLGKAWSKADLTKLARLSEDPDFLRQTIPEHAGGADLDWECISRHFGRWSRGGTAVKHQFYSVVRLMKEARREGRKGSNYVELVKNALQELPEKQGTVYEIQAYLKAKHSSSLDKYKVKGQVRWKKAVGEVLREESSLFEAVGKTEGGKIKWRLKGGQ